MAATLSRMSAGSLSQASSHSHPSAVACPPLRRWISHLSPTPFGCTFFINGSSGKVSNSYFRR